MKKIMLLMLIEVISVATWAEMTPRIVSSAIRESDPTILDVTYIVAADQPTVNVRALAFEDGMRSFWKVVRPETFVDGTAANIGDGIAANVEHKLSWKVSSDWATELAKVKFEILVSDVAQLPLETMEIPAAGKYPKTEVFVGSQNATNVFNALMWYYADKASDLEIVDGYLYYVGKELMANKTVLSNRTEVPSDKLLSILYCYDKMGLEPLVGPHCKLVRDALRKSIWFNSTIQAAIKKGAAVGDLYVGEKAYLAVDLTTGEETYFDSMPLAGWGDEYKTTKMLFRRIEPGNVTMGGIKPITITKPYYIGVFEVTQKQWTFVSGSNPSNYNGDMCPVENVSYNDIRGASKGSKWPNSAEYDSTSFLGKLESKTGKKFDLPTESQWEYACRAGTSYSSFNNYGSSSSDLTMVGRWALNRYDGKGGHSVHTTVGSYLPNAWGLYDMHGNVWEWCLDWYSYIASDESTDFGGATSGSKRVVRGGSWSDDYDYASCSKRYYFYPSDRNNYYGFRLVKAIVND